MIIHRAGAVCSGICYTSMSLTIPDTMEVIELWEYEIRERELKREVGTIGIYTQEYHDMKLAEWTEKHPEERKAQFRKASKKYYDYMKDDEEFQQKNREDAAAGMRKLYARRRAEAEADPEKMKELRAKKAETMRKYRAKKRAEAQAKKEQGK